MIAHKGIQLDGTSHIFILRLWRFNISLTPNFSVSNHSMDGDGRRIPQSAWRWRMERVAQAGTKLNKQNVFDDFIAASEWLLLMVHLPAKLTIGGGGNGDCWCLHDPTGYLLQRCQLWVMMDMLQFCSILIGWAWASEYGFPENRGRVQTYMPTLHCIT